MDALVVEDQDDAPEIDAAASIRLTDAFARGTGYGLVRLGAAEVGQALPPVFVWWRDFAARYVGSLCLHASGTEAEDARNAAERTAADRGGTVIPGVDRADDGGGRISDPGCLAGVVG